MTATTTAAKAVYAEAICTHCKPARPFRYQARPGQPAPTSCGRIACRARAEWTELEWAEHARLKVIRRACGLPLDSLATEALHRTGIDL